MGLPCCELSSSVVEVGLVLGWGDVPEGAVKAAMVVPVDLFEGGDLNVAATAPGTAGPDELGLVQRVHGLGEGVVTAVPA